VSSPNFSKSLAELFDAERAVRRIHASLLAEADDAALIQALRVETDKAMTSKESDGAGDAGAESAMRLVRVAALLGELEGAAVVDMLVDILGSEESEARHAAGEALLELAYERFKEVALGVERALARLPAGNAALTELPYMLAEVGEPGCVKLLGRFLQHADAEAVAAAIESLVELADPSAAPLLAPLEKDARQVELDDSEDGSVSIGDLAAEARQLLAQVSEMEEEPAPPPRRGKDARS
jgi:hypothetical protein